MARLSDLILAFAATAFLTGGCSTLKDAPSLRKEFKVLDNQDYRDGADGDTFGRMLADLQHDADLAQGRSRKWSRAEGFFSAAILAAAAYGGFNTVYDGGNLEDAAFAAASITSLRTFAKPKDRRDAFQRAADEINCIGKHAKVFKTDTRYRLTATGDGGVAALGAGGAGMTALSNEIEAKLQGLIESSNRKAEGTLSKGDADALADARVSAALQRAVLLEASQKLLRAGAMHDEILDERFSLVNGEYRAALSALFKTLRYPEVSYDAAVADYGKAAAQAEQTGDEGLESAGSFKALGIISVGVLDDAKKIAEAKAALLACNKDE